MGSSGERKSSDTLRINKPALAGSGNGDIGGGAGGGNPAPAPDTNNLCPVRFRVKLTRQDIPAGTTLTLEGNVLTAQGMGEIGKLNARTSKRLEACLGLGIAYPAITTVVDQGVCYAEFSQ